MPATAPLITGTDFICVPTQDYAAAEEFYGGVLGLEQSAKYDKIPGGEFETGSLTLQVIDTNAIGREFQPQAFPIALHTEDVAAARSQLESQGVSFLDDTMDSGVCHMAFFKDPDGNTFCLHNRYAPEQG